MKAKSVPEGYNSLYPFIKLKDAEKVMAFYKKVSGAKEAGRITMSDGSPVLCELDSGDCGFPGEKIFLKMRIFFPKPFVVQNKHHSQYTCNS
jgi:hypothetical protein